MKKLILLFIFVFVLPMYSQGTMSIYGYENYWYNIDTSKDTIEIDGKMYIHTPKYDTLVVPTGMSTINLVTGEVQENVYKYLIIEDIKNSCPVCDNNETEYDILHILSSSKDRYMPRVGTEFKECTLKICKSCGNVYVARKQVLKRIE